MTISKTSTWVHDEIKKDSSEPDPTKLDSELLRIPYQYGKWINILAIEKEFYLKFHKKLKWLKQRKFDYYRGFPNDDYMDGKISSKKYNTNALASSAVEADDDVIQCETRMDLQGNKIDQITEFLKAINSRGWNIKNAIDFIKFNNAEH